MEYDFPTSTGSDYWAKDYTGSYPFDYIADHGEWMDSGFFPEDVRARLKGGQVKARRHNDYAMHYYCVSLFLGHRNFSV